MPPRSSSLRALATALLLLVIVGCGSSSGSASNAAADLQADRSDPWSFGRLDVLTSGQDRVELRNQGNASLDLISISLLGDAAFRILSVSQGSTGLTAPFAVTLRPQEAVVVAVAFEPTVTGSFAARMTVQHSAGGPLEISLVGEGVATAPAALLVSWPSPHDLGTVQLATGSQAEGTLWLSNPGGQSLQLSSLGLVSGGVFWISAVRDSAGQPLSVPYATSIAPGTSVEVVVACLPSALAGVQDQLEIAHNAANLASPVRIDLSATGVEPSYQVQASHSLSLAGSTRATGYGMSNKLLRAGNKLFAVWLDNVSVARVAELDLNSGQWGAPVLLGNGTDNHGGPTITRDSQGYLHTLFGPHHAPLQYRRSSQPDDASAWGPVETFGLKATYPSLVCDTDDALHVAYRGGSDRWRMMYQSRPAGGSWSAPLELAWTGQSVGYSQYGNSLAVEADGTLHLGFHIYDTAPGNSRGHSLGYLRSPDGGTTWENAAGISMTLPVSPASSCFIEQGAGLDMRIGNLVLDPDGRPWLAAVHIESQTVLLWHHDGSAWLSIDLGPVLAAQIPGWVLVDATLCFDRHGALYVAASVAASTATTWFGDPSTEVVLLTSVDRGFSFASRLISNPDPTVSSWLTSLERPHGADPIDLPAFLYTYGNKGSGTTGGLPTEVMCIELERQ